MWAADSSSPVAFTNVSTKPNDVNPMPCTNWNDNPAFSTLLSHSIQNCSCSHFLYCDMLYFHPELYLLLLNLFCTGRVHTMNYQLSLVKYVLSVTASTALLSHIFCHISLHLHCICVTLQSVRSWIVFEEHM